MREKEIDELNKIGTIEAPMRALEYFAYACKQQLFWDGNKRTSTIAASKSVIWLPQAGGIKVLTVEQYSFGEEG